MKLRGFEIVKRFNSAQIELPQRSTKFSAGYDFHAAEDIIIPSHAYAIAQKLNDVDEDLPVIVKPTCIKTGIKAYMQEDEVLEIFMRSSAPGKLGLVMANSVGIIDADYYGNESNDGEIGFLVYNLGTEDIHIHKGDKIGQGIFTKFLKIDNDCAEGDRTGGYGSTGR